MSEENLEIIRRAYEAFNRGDPDGMVVDFAPTFEYVATGAILGSSGVYRGPEGYKAFLGLFWDEFQDARVELHGLIDAGDQVLAELSLRGRGKKSGAEARWDIWQLWTLRDGMAVYAQGFTKRPDALEAGGLSE
jgi:ketosteroid isomerase-like protein